MIDKVPGPVGIAVTAVGGREDVVSAGDWQSGVAWSTIKVPLAIAVERSSPPALDEAATAITESDNDAAESLWNVLGGEAASATAIDAVLSEAGDISTLVPAPFFGETEWRLTNQARFGSRLPCIESSTRVLELMGQITPDQSWGLGRIPGSRFKGGWAPDENGGYLVRQFGIVPAAGGDVAVAIAIDSPSFDEGTESLSRVAEALAPQLRSMRGGRC